MKKNIREVRIERELPLSSENKVELPYVHHQQWTRVYVSIKENSEHIISLSSKSKIVEYGRDSLMTIAENYRASIDRSTLSENESTCHYEHR